jgi:hypothetical protein
LTLTQVKYVSLFFLSYLVTGCSLSNCDKQLARAVSSNGKRTAVLEVSDGCGGATVGYVTDLTLTRQPRSIFGEDGTIWTSRGWDDADLRWITPTRLEVSFRHAVEDRRIALRTTRWYDVDIVYSFAEGPARGGSFPDFTSPSQ